MTASNPIFRVYIAGKLGAPKVLPKDACRTKWIGVANVIYACPDATQDEQFKKVLGRSPNYQTNKITKVFPECVIVRSLYALRVALAWRRGDAVTKDKTPQAQGRPRVLTTEQARYVKGIRDVPDRPSSRELGKILGCAHGTISSIWRGETWKELEVG